ncbi:MAG: hypothetical protein ACTHW2_08085 [Tissierella sp.]
MRQNLFGKDGEIEQVYEAFKFKIIEIDEVVFSNKAKGNKESMLVI